MKNIIIVLSVFLATSFASFAQSTETSKKEQTQKPVYTCSHHTDVVSDKPGKCSKCDMKMVEKSTLKLNTSVKGSQSTKSKEVAYECSMCKVTSKKPGNCPKCGMKMSEKKS